MADHASRKPANRPSRRQDLIEGRHRTLLAAAVGVRHGGRYRRARGHDPGRILLPFLLPRTAARRRRRAVAGDWIAATERLLTAARTPTELCDVPIGLLDEIDNYEQSARIFFLSSATAPLLVDRIRRDARNRLIKAAAKAVRRVAPERSSAEAQVNGVSMIVVYETAIRTQLGARRAVPHARATPVP